jgi:hypothetical protein
MCKLQIIKSDILSETYRNHDALSARRIENKELLCILFEPSCFGTAGLQMINLLNI